MKKYETSKIVAIAFAVLLALSVLSMVLGSLMPLFWGDDESDTAAQPISQSGSDDRIPLGNFGKLVDHPLDSIADGLNASPPGVVVAQYVRAEGLGGTPLAGRTVPHEFYGTNVSDSYSAVFMDGSQIGLHTLYPRKLVLGSAIVAPSKYEGYLVLVRNRDVCNIMGDPCVLGPRSKVEETVDGIDDEGAPNAYPNFAVLLENVELDAPYQEVSSYSSIADQYYSAVRPVGGVGDVGGRCERTITCLGISETATARVNELAANTTDTLECDVTFGHDDLRLTTITITGDCDAVMTAVMD